MNWLRLYTEVTEDRKLRRLPPAQRWLWIAMLTEARKSPQPGRLLLTDGVPTTIDDLADIAAIPLDDVRAGLEAFEAQKMIGWEGDVIVLVNWGKRQFESDNSTTRWRRWKDKQRTNVEGDDAPTPGQQTANVGANVGPTPPDNREQRQRTETDGTSRAAGAARRRDADPDTAAAASDTADILIQCAWVEDEYPDVLQQVLRSWQLVDQFNPRDGPVEAEKYGRHWARSRRKPRDWYRAWLNWLKKSVEFDAMTGTARRVTGDEADRVIDDMDLED